MERIGDTRLKILFLVMARPGVSLRELAAGVGTNAANVRAHLWALRREKLVTWGYRKGRHSEKRTLRATSVFIRAEDL